MTGAATKVKRAIKSTGGLASVESSGPNSSSIVDNQSQNTTSAVTDRALMEKMRSQIDSLTDALSKAEDRSRTLETAVRRRELELGKELQRITSRSIEGTVDGEGRMEMLVMADSANARIIDQLNGQVDFLNDQLATREAQLADLGEKLVGAKELRIECENRGKLLDASREENAMLVAELRELEERVGFSCVSNYYVRLVTFLIIICRLRNLITTRTLKADSPSTH